MAKRKAKQVAVVEAAVIAPATIEFTRESLAAFNVTWRTNRWCYFADGATTVTCNALSLSEARTALGRHSVPDRCHGRGYIQVMSDVYDNCSGCSGCEPLSLLTSARMADSNAYTRERVMKRYVGHAIGVFFWRAAHLPVHTPVANAVRGFQALVQIGRAVAAAGSLGVALGGFIANTKTMWQQVDRGRWYEVVGGRGRAKALAGFVGQCVSTYNDATYGTPSATLVDANGLKRSVPRSQLGPIATPSTVDPEETPVAVVDRKKAAVAQRPIYMGKHGKNGETGYVYSGPHRGRSGRVFWKAPDNSRVGLKTCSCKVRCTCEVLWCSSHDVAPDASSTTVTSLGDTPYATAELIAVMLLECGFEDVSAAWMDVAKVFARAHCA